MEDGGAERAEGEGGAGEGVGELFHQNELVSVAFGRPRVYWWLWIWFRVVSREGQTSKLSAPSKKVLELGGH